MYLECSGWGNRLHSHKYYTNTDLINFFTANFTVELPQIESKQKSDFILELGYVLLWKNIYNKYQSSKNCYFVLYEKLTSTNYIKALLEKINLTECKNIDLNYFKNSNKKKLNFDFSNSVYEDAKKVYSIFNEKLILK